MSSLDRSIPYVLPIRDRADVIHRLLDERLGTLLPRIMRDSGFDMWLIICQEDDLDPVFRTLIPMDTWCPILQMLVFVDGGEPDGVECLNLSMTNTHGLYDKLWSGRHHEEQWALLRRVIDERAPRCIGINVGSVQWAAGGLTHNLYTRLVEALPDVYVQRLTSAESLVTRFMSILTEAELKVYTHVVSVAHCLLAKCYSRDTIAPGVTTVTDLEFAYWQHCADLGLEPAFKPLFKIVRSASDRARHGERDQIIRPGDMIRSDVGIKYLRLNSDHQEWAYILRPGESCAPEGLRHLMSEGNRLQDVFMAEFVQGLTGNELLANVLAQAYAEGIPNPKVYSHSLGYFLHEPGPLIGLPWEQERCEGRGDVVLMHNNTFAMELSIADAVPEWNGQQVVFPLEQDVAFTREGCYPIDGRQTEFHIV